jgi:hypothetical protein
MKVVISIAILYGFCLPLHSQVETDRIFEFLRLPVSAKSTSLGGLLMNFADTDMASARDNPATLSNMHHEALSFHHNFHFAGIQNGFFGFGYDPGVWDLTTFLGVQYVDYGEFQGADEFGNLTNSFDAFEYAVNLGASKKLSGGWQAGATLRFVGSRLDSYHSSGLSGDLGLYYQDSTGRFSFGFVLREVGTQLTRYSQTSGSEALPFDIQIGISQRLKYLPFRVYFTYHHLQKWNIIYDNPNEEEESIFLGDAESGQSDFGRWVDNLFRHIVLGGEFSLGKAENFQIRVGYNHSRRRELLVSSQGNLAGFSLGFGIQIKMFKLDYGLGVHHIAGGVHHIGITTNLMKFRKESDIL